MAVESFYANENFLNIVYACDIALEDHFKSLMFLDQPDRVIYSSNAYALRKRSDQNGGELNLPFLNYWLRNEEPGLRHWWNLASYTKGVYVPELEAKVRYAPITLSYEVSYWCHRDDELKYVISEINFDADNITTLYPTVAIQSENLPFAALLSYSGNQYDPTYNENDWLERNNIHTASLDLSLNTMNLKTNFAITIPTEVVFEMYAISQEGSISDVIS